MNNPLNTSGLSKKTILIFAGVAILILALVSYAVASYGIRSPDSDQLTVHPTATPSPSPSPSPSPVPQATLSKPVFAVAPLTVGESTTLTTTLSDAYPGVQVDFYDQNGNLIGSDLTDVSGTAVINISPPVGTWIYHANTIHP